MKLELDLSSSEVKQEKGFEVRKVQRLGSTSLFITLPKKWVNRWGIKPGDKVFLELLSDGSLRLLSERSRQNQGKKTVRIDLNSLKLDVSHVIRALYDLGYDEIIFEFKKDMQSKVVSQLRTEIEKYSGLELSEYSETTAKVDCVVDDSKFSVDTLIKRLLSIMSRKIDEIITYLNPNTQKEIDRPVTADDVARVYHLLLRKIYKESQPLQLTMKNYMILPMLNNLYIIFLELERLQDKLKASNLSDEEKKTVVDILHKYSDIEDLVVMSVLFSSIKRVSMALNILSDIEKLMSNLSGELGEILSRINALFYESINSSVGILFIDKTVFNEDNKNEGS